ncbi:MAG: InlB B-repeat-containing protein [Oscillospiraceae bacterium]|nr:InlB B-repeat-containing protein [Oscillospiraceae bacterium]
MKKALSLLLAAIMIASLAVTAFAEETAPPKPYRNSDTDRNISDAPWAYFVCADDEDHKLGMLYAFSSEEVIKDEETGEYYASVTFSTPAYLEAFNTVYSGHVFSEDVSSAITLRYKWDPSAVDEDLPNVTGLWVPTENALNIALKHEQQTAREYTVTYTDGTGNADIFANQKYTVPEGTATPAFAGTPELYGYDFIGWEPAVAATVTADAAYTAKWQEHAFTVKFDSNGGSAIASRGMLYKHSIGTLPLPEKDGFEFIGWYVNGDKIDENYTILGDVTLVAQWRKEEAKEVKFGYTVSKGVEVPEGLKNVYKSEEDVKTALIRKSAWFEEKNKNYNYEFMEITLVKYNEETKKWESAEQGEYPDDEHEFVIPYPKGAGKTGYTYVVTHLITYGDKAGEVEVLSYTKGSDGLHVKTETLSPFCVAYAKGTTVIKPDDDTNVNNDKYKLRVGTDIEVPYALRYKFDDTDEMKRAIWKEAYAEGRMGLDYYIVYRDVDLLEWNPITKKWVEMDEEDYPAEGVEVTLSYPTGTARKGYDFIVAGLAEEGNSAGDIEILDYTKETKGIKVKIYGPMVLGITYAAYDDGISIKPVEKPTNSVVVDLTEEGENPNTGVSVLVAPAAAAAVVSFGAAVVLGKRKKK